MNHCGTQVLDTARLILRPFAVADYTAAYRNWTSDPEVTRFLRWPAHSSPEVTRAVLAEWISAYQSPDFYQWAIVPKDGRKEPIGAISVVEQNQRLGIAHIGYCIGRPWWGRGYTGEAFSAVITFLFTRVGVNRIESQHDPENPASGRVMQKCGLTREGTLRQADYSNRGVVDAVMYSILAQDYHP